MSIEYLDKKPKASSTTKKQSSKSSKKSESKINRQTFILMQFLLQDIHMILKMILKN